MQAADQGGKDQEIQHIGSDDRVSMLFVAKIDSRLV